MRLGNLACLLPTLAGTDGECRLSADIAEFVKEGRMPLSGMRFIVLQCKAPALADWMGVRLV